MNIELKHVIIAFFSFVLVLATLLIPVKLENKNELGAARLGFPAYFLGQNFSHKYEKYYFFPTWEKVDLGGKYPFVEFRVSGLIADFILIFLGFEILIYFLEAIDFSLRKRRT